MSYSLLDKAKHIRPFVNFNVKLKEVKSGKIDSKTRKLINKFFKIIEGSATKISKGPKKGQTHYESGLANGLKYALKPTAKQRETYERLAGQEAHTITVVGRNGKKRTIPALKAVWFDSIQGKSGKLLKPRIRIRKSGQATYSIGLVEFGFIPIDPVKLAVNANAELRRLFTEAPDTEKFAIKCGKSQTKLAWSKSLLLDKVRDYIGRYEDWRDWMIGLVPIYLKGQKGFLEYHASREATLKDAKHTRAKRRRDRAKAIKAAKQAKGRKHGKGSAKDSRNRR